MVAKYLRYYLNPDKVMSWHLSREGAGARSPALFKHLTCSTLSMRP